MTPNYPKNTTNENKKKYMTKIKKRFHENESEIATT